MSELHYSVSGSGKPLLVLHGLFGSGKNWQSHTRRFANHFQVYNVDLRNHGQSFHADEMNYSVMAADLRRLLQRLDLENCYILGHSMGGKVAMTLAMLNPDLVTAMVVADIAPASYFHHYDDLINPILALRLDTIESRAQADQLLRQNIPEDQLRAFLLQNLVRESDSWHWRVNWQVIQRDMEWLTGFDVLPGDWRVDVPTLFLRGGNSDYIGDAETEVIRQHFSDYKIETIEAAGHWLHAENPDAFNRFALAFLLGPVNAI
ncbi:MAG: alpha/beta fold hydrolase [Gammaproteobacteria bacterium]|nr:alpha/beta fold hydrolase [Gammaproteobacteria bacterium]